MGALDGKVAIITGGTSGIGARTAELFVAEGAKVVVAGRRQTQGESLAKALGSAAIFVRTDVTKEGDIKALIEQTLAKFGRLNCLFNNAGNPGRLTSITDLDVDHLDTVIATHLRAVVLGMKYAAPAMIRQGSGSIINTGSIAGLRAGCSAHSYSAAKAAVIHVTRCVAAELGEKGIRVNSISPGAPSSPASSRKAPAWRTPWRRAPPTASRSASRPPSRCRVPVCPRISRRRRSTSPATPAVSSADRTWWSTAATSAAVAGRSW